LPQHFWQRDIGASTSGLAAGIIVDHFGYSAAFLTFGGAACAALAALFMAMPETAPNKATEIAVLEGSIKAPGAGII
jgi:sugar phosphate permease